MAILELRGLTKHFGGLTAINNLSLSVNEGELRCIIGPNGAGKSTLFGLISGKIKPDQGQIVFKEQMLNGLSVQQISRLGIGRKFQSPTIFGDLSVLANLQVALNGKAAMRELLVPWRNGESAVIEEILSTIELQDKRHLPAQSLSHGEKQWLEIGMVLVSRPVLLLLDEPTAGMTPAETHKTAQLIRRIAQETTTVVIEHDLKFIREIGHIVTVLQHGSLLAQGPIDDIAQDQKVRQAYLGTKVL
ncbi:MAG: ABC transporter ATP-binding protein [Chloroflexota bacterium]|nr:MAG: ABC transporter ATP-binding protein [Chloroflexota bacterium]